MDAEVIAALVGVPASVAVAAIAYPVGRGVARRQADDAKRQWLRGERQAAARSLAVAATDFIEAAEMVREAVTRPDYGHTRRREIADRKRLDPALYEGPKQALRALHTALPAVALHGPESVTEAAQRVYDTALAATGQLLHCDATAVQRSVVIAQALEKGPTQERTEAALEDLDTAYARLAAPLGLPEFVTGVTEVLDETALLVPCLKAVRIDSPQGDPKGQVEALQELRKVREQMSGRQDSDIGELADMLLSYLPMVEAVAGAKAGHIGVPDVLSVIEEVVTPSSLAELSRMTEANQDHLNQLPKEVQDEPEVLALQEMMNQFGDGGAVEALQQVSEYFAMGNDVIHASLAKDIDPNFAVAAWLSHLPSLAARVVAAAEMPEATHDQVIQIHKKALDRRANHARDEAAAGMVQVVEARLEFLDTAREIAGAN